MNRIICHICLFFACAYAIAQSAPVKIQPNPGNLAPAQIPQTAGFPQTSLQQGASPEDLKAAQEAQKLAEQEAAAKKAEENIKKYSSLFPPTEGATGKIGAGFWESHWGYAAAAAALLAIIACIAFRPKKKPEATPFEKASAKLGEAEKIYAASGAKAYAQEVSQAVRDYIEAVHNLPAPERTTEEFLQIAASAPQLDEKERGILENMLKLADIAKFAQHSFRGEEKSKLLSDARDFIFYDNERISQKQKSEKAESSAPEKSIKGTANPAEGSGQDEPTQEK